MTVFAVAMAFLESAVVVYLRAIYYPGGFLFPLAPIDDRIAVTELVRELATLMMLLAPGALLTRRILDRFAWFCYCFAVWDLFYYVFLKLILGWPESLFTWDILFLLPLPWVGPVLAPCMVSAGLIILAAVLLRRRELSPSYRPLLWQWGMLLVAGSLILWTFMEGPCRQLLSRHSLIEGAASNLLSALSGYMPSRYQWRAFLLAFVIAGWAVLAMARDGCEKNGTARRRE